jgi:hypothetical protein
LARVDLPEVFFDRIDLPNADLEGAHGLEDNPRKKEQTMPMEGQLGISFPKSHQTPVFFAERGWMIADVSNTAPSKNGAFGKGEAGFHERGSVSSPSVLLSPTSCSSGSGGFSLSLTKGHFHTHEWCI